MHHFTPVYCWISNKIPKHHKESSLDGMHCVINITSNESLSLGFKWSGVTSCERTELPHKQLGQEDKKTKKHYSLNFLRSAHQNSKCLLLKTKQANRNHALEIIFMANTTEKILGNTFVFHGECIAPVTLPSRKPGFPSSWCCLDKLELSVQGSIQLAHQILQNSLCFLCLTLFILLLVVFSVSFCCCLLPTLTTLQLLAGQAQQFHVRNAGKRSIPWFFCAQ